MSTISKTFDPALTRIPRTRSGHGGNWRSLIRQVLDAVAAGRSAEAEYHRMIARGMGPAQAARKAFDATVATG